MVCPLPSLSLFVPCPPLLSPSRSHRPSLPFPGPCGLHERGPIRIAKVACPLPRGPGTRGGCPILSCPFRLEADDGLLNEPFARYDARRETVPAPWFRRPVCSGLGFSAKPGSPRINLDSSDTHKHYGQLKNLKSSKVAVRCCTPATGFSNNLRPKNDFHDEDGLRNRSIMINHDRS